jgi:unsaturated rhamnogalacturonyl hydrolase
MLINSILISKLRLLSICFALYLSVLTVTAQVNVGLDNWFNHETSIKTGQPYHYLWSDTAWSGYSRWGKIFTDKGAKISHVTKPDKQELAKIQIYIIVDPDTTSENPNPNYILPQDVKAIKAWVKRGGVLMILANDAPNCEFTHLNQLANTFGINFNHVSLHPVVNKNWEMGAFIDLPDHPVFKNVSKIYLKEISSLTLTGKATPVLTENGNVVMAEYKYGKGFVFVVGDPWIYNEYMDHDRLPADFTNRAAAESLTDYLIQKTRRK